MDKKYCDIIHLSQVSSTNEYMKELVRRDMPAEGTMVFTDHQTAGKGIDSNTWESEAGKNILMSVVYYPAFIPVENQFRISMAIALGIKDFLQSHLPHEKIMIKWPNDILAGGKKIAGILIVNEISGSKFEHLIAGIGLNVNQRTFSEDIPDPTSMAILSGNSYDLEEETLKLRDCVLLRYEQLKEGMFELIRTDYYNSLLGLNESRKYRYKGNEIDAVITGVDEFGRLQLETDSGNIVCDLKEISFIL
jgi:BirA family biotin operon repressor/biotin-[acetyl-CoA-carboxylase] ligase